MVEINPLTYLILSIVIVVDCVALVHY
jgi:hypothetical protein